MDGLNQRVRNMSDEIETYVFDGTEVKKTGRTAVRKLRQREMTLVEITPVDTSFDWKKWVDPVSLFVVQPTEIPEGACCAAEKRNINGGCDNCGDPCL